MNRKLAFCIVLPGIALFGAIPVLAGSVFVGELLSGNVVEVDELGTKTIFASGDRVYSSSIRMGTHSCSTAACRR